MKVTKRDRDALKAIYEHFLEHKYPPSLEEMCGYLGVRSRSTAKKRIEKLVELGLIEVEAGKPRTITLKTEAIEHVTEGIE